MITASLTVQTPMFCGRGGTRADTFRIPELRAAMRAALRMLLVDLAADEGELLEIDARLFGTAAGRRSGGEGSIRLRPLRPLPPVTKDENPDWLGQRDREIGNQFRPLVYLAGQQLARWNGAAHRTELTRGFVAPGETVEVGISSEDPADEELGATLVWVVSKLMGIGARSRRGFGSFDVAFDNQQNALVPGVGSELGAAMLEVRASLAGACGWLDRFVDGGAGGGPASSLGDRWMHARHVVGAGTAVDAMRVAGSLLRMGRAPVHRGDGGHANYVTMEHVGATTVLRGAAFGLPVTVERNGHRVTHAGRRASPLWVKPIRGEGGWDLLAHVPSGVIHPDEVALEAGGETFSISDERAEAVLRVFLQRFDNGPG